MNWIFRVWMCSLVVAYVGLFLALNGLTWVGTIMIVVAVIATLVCVPIYVEMKDNEDY